MSEPQRLYSIRTKLGLSQEQMARILGVSFTSVNRWEGGHSSPLGTTHDLYDALETALRSGYSAAEIRRAASNERSAFLYNVFRMAYGPKRRVLK